MSWPGGEQLQQQPPGTDSPLAGDPLAGLYLHKQTQQADSLRPKGVLSSLTNQNTRLSHFPPNQHPTNTNKCTLPPQQVSDKYGLIYVVTKLGLLFVYDLESATAVYRNRISPDPIFLATPR